MGQTVLSRDTNLSKTFQGVRKKLFTEPYRGNLGEQYCSNLIVSWPDHLLKMFANANTTQIKPFSIKTD